MAWEKELGMRVGARCHHPPVTGTELWGLLPWGWGWGLTTPCVIGLWAALAPSTAGE